MLTSLTHGLLREGCRSFGKSPNLKSFGLLLEVESGSGQAAMAAMEKGLYYIDLTKSDQHLKWVSNVLDKKAIHLVCQQADCLYSESLAAALQEILSANVCHDLLFTFSVGCCCCCS